MSLRYVGPDGSSDVGIGLDDVAAELATPESLARQNLDASYARATYFDAERFKSGRTDLQAAHAACAAATAFSKGATVRLSSRTWDVEGGLAMSGYSCGLVGMGSSWSSGGAGLPTGTVLHASSQSGPVLNMDGWLAPNSMRGRVPIGMFALRGSGLADPSKVNAGLASRDGGAIAGVIISDISISHTGGPCVDFNRLYLGDMERVTAITPVGAKANDVPYMVFRGCNGNRFVGLGFRSMTSSDDTGASGALVVTDDTVGSGSSTNEWVAPWFEFLHMPTGGTLINNMANKQRWSGVYFVDCGKEAGATGTSLVTFGVPPAGGDSGGNEFMGAIPGTGSGVADTGIRMKQSRNRVVGTKGFPGGNVTLDAGVGWTFVELGGSVSGVGTGDAFVDNSGQTTNTLIDHTRGIAKYGGYTQDEGGGANAGVRFVNGTGTTGTVSFGSVGNRVQNVGGNTYFTVGTGGQYYYFRNAAAVNAVSIRTDKPAITFGDYGATPTPAVAYRGQLAVQHSTSGLADRAVMCLKSAADTYSWVDLAPPAAATQAEAEAGTSTEARTWTPERVRQAAGASPAFDRRSRYDVRLAGVVGDGIANDSAAAATAADYCRANGLAFWLPTGLTMRLGTAETLNLRYIDAQLDGVVSVDHNATVGIQWGDNSTTTVRRIIQFARIINTTSNPTNPSLRIVGVKNTDSVLGAFDYLEFYANGNDNLLASVAYGSYRFSGAIGSRIEFTGLNGGWINDNKFFGGRLKVVRFTGDYKHNGNKFYGPTWESGTLDLQSGSANLFRDARCEDTLTATFGVNTSHNLVEDSWTSNPAGIQPAVTVTDLGRENFVVSSRTTRLRPVELVRLDRFTRSFDGASEYPCQAPPIPGLRSLAVRGANSLMVDTGILPIEHSPEAVSGVGEVMSRVTRFVFTSSHRVWRPQIYCYDANMTALTASDTTPHIDLIGGWVAAGSSYSKSASNSGTARICIIDPAVKYIRFTFRSASAAGTVFDWASLSAYVQEPHLDSVANLWKRALTQPLYQATAPTQGIARPGESIGHATGRFTCVDRRDTILAAGAAGAATSITVGSATGMASGDVIGIVLDTGVTHWTTISGAPVDAVVTLTTALPSAAATGRAVATNRWVSIT